MKKYRVDYTVIYSRSSASMDYYVIIEAESFYRAFEKYKKTMARCQVADSKIEMRKFELIEEEKE